MLEIALHTGTEHPSLLWIVLPSIATFVSGILIGTYAGRDRDVAETNDAETAS